MLADADASRAAQPALAHTAYACKVQFCVTVPSVSLAVTDHTVVELGMLMLMATRAMPGTFPPPPITTVPAGQVAVALLDALLFEALTAPGTI